MPLARVVLILVVLLELALLAVYGHSRNLLLNRHIARRQEEWKREMFRHQELMRTVARARQPEHLLKKSNDFNLEMEGVDASRFRNSSGRPDEVSARGRRR